MSVTTVLPGASVTAATPEELASLGIQTHQSQLSLPQSTYLVAGDTTTGKTSLMAGMPGNIILDWERKVSAIPQVQRQGSSFVEISSLDQFEALIKTLCGKGAGWNDIRHVTIDSLGVWEDATTVSLERRFGTPLAKINGGYGAGFNLRASTMFNHLRALRGAGFGWTVICHLRRKSIGKDSSEKEVIRLAGSDSTIEPIHREAIYRFLVRKHVAFKVLSTKKVAGHDIPDKTEERLRFSLQFKAGSDGDGHLDMDSWQPGSMLQEYLPLSMDLPALGRWAAVSAVLEAARDAASKETAAPEISHEQ